MNIRETHFVKHYPEDYQCNENIDSCECELCYVVETANIFLKEKLQLRLDLDKAGEREMGLRDVLEEIEAVSCGETQIQSDGSYNDSDGMKWIYDRIQALKEKEQPHE